jgi:hypothetical protein
MDFDILKSVAATDHGELRASLLGEHLDKLGDDAVCLWRLQEQLDHLVNNCGDPALALDCLSRALQGRASLLAQLVRRLEQALAEEG